MATSIPGTEAARPDFFFSPDGQSLAFFTDRELKKVSLAGGPALTLCPVSTSRGGSWGPDDLIIFGQRGGGLSQVPAVGGNPQVLTTPDVANGVDHRWPEFLPGGKAVLFTIRSRNPDGYDIGVLDLETGQSKIVLQGGRQAHYTLTGHLVYAQPGAGTLMAAPFDLGGLEVTGDPVPILQGVRHSPLVAVDYALSNNGTLIYSPQSGAGGYDLVWVDREGQENLLTEEPRPFTHIRLSPDGQQVVLDMTGDIWIYDVERGTLIRLTTDGGNIHPVWTPDGTRVTFNDQLGNLHWKMQTEVGRSRRF